MSIEHSPARGGRAETLEPVDVFLTESEVAAFLVASKRTLQRWRQEGSGPPFRRFGGLIRYARCDIERWAGNQSRVSTSGTGHEAV
jgi:hypothetical protein